MMNVIKYQILLGSVSVIANDHPEAVADLLLTLLKMETDPPQHPEDVPMSKGIGMREHIAMIAEATREMAEAASMVRGDVTNIGLLWQTIPHRRPRGVEPSRNLVDRQPLRLQCDYELRGHIVPLANRPAPPGVVESPMALPTHSREVVGIVVSPTQIGPVVGTLRIIGPTNAAFHRRAVKRVQSQVHGLVASARALPLSAVRAAGRVSRGRIPRANGVMLHQSPNDLLSDSDRCGNLSLSHPVGIEAAHRRHQFGWIFLRWPRLPLVDSCWHATSIARQCHRKAAT
jgi:hypothetical protein